MEVTIENQQKKVSLNRPQIKKIVQIALRHEGVKTGFLSVVFTTHQKIRALNQKFLHKNYATDVLAFDLSDDWDKDMFNGEIIISLDAAIKNAKVYDVSLDKEVILYVIHGILHLTGYDDHKPDDIKKMRKKEKEILVYVGNKITKILQL